MSPSRTIRAVARVVERGVRRHALAGLFFILTFRNRKAKEDLGHAPNLRHKYRNRGITLSEVRDELAGDAPFAGIASDGQPFGDGC